MEISLKKGRLTNNKGYNTKVLHRKQIKTLKKVKKVLDKEKSF